jgi:hypothetical protein
MNATETIRNLLTAPFKGNVFDEEPHPFGEVVEIEAVPFEAKRIRIRIQDRQSDLVRDASLLAFYVAGMPVIMEIEEMNDAGE